MVEIYGSWISGLAQDGGALKIIKSSGLIAGIELSSSINEIDLVKSAGLKYNLHNPLRENKIGLDNKKFVSTMISSPNIVKACQESFPPAVGFHAGYSSLEDINVTTQGILLTTLKSIKFLDEVLNKKIIFESTCYNESHFKSGKKEVASWVTGPKFMKSVISNSNAGFLFDISHNLASGTTKILQNEYKGNIQDYFAQILEVVAKETYQMHLNVCEGNEKEGFIDVHAPLKPSQKNSKLTLLLAKEVLDSCPNLNTITLELNQVGTPKQHARLLVEQAKIIQKNLL